MPCRVNPFVLRSAVTIAVTPRSLSHANKRRNSARTVDWFWSPPEQHLDRVQDHPLGTNGVDRFPEAEKQSLEIVRPGLGDFMGFEMHIIEHHPATRPEPRHVDADRTRVVVDLYRRLLEAHEHAWLAEPLRSRRQELQREQGLPAPGATTHERGAPARQTASSDFIQPCDSGRGLGNGTASRTPRAMVFHRRQLRDLGTGDNSVGLLKR